MLMRSNSFSFYRGQALKKILSFYLNMSWFFFPKHSITIGDFSHYFVQICLRLFISSQLIRLASFFINDSLSSISFQLNQLLIFLPQFFQHVKRFFHPIISCYQLMLMIRASLNLLDGFLLFFSIRLEIFLLEAVFITCVYQLDNYLFDKTYARKKVTCNALVIKIKIGHQAHNLSYDKETYLY